MVQNLRNQNADLANPNEFKLHFRMCVSFWTRQYSYMGLTPSGGIRHESIPRKKVQLSTLSPAINHQGCSNEVGFEDLVKLEESQICGKSIENDGKIFPNVSL